jgi:hypothetical protein
MYQWDGGEINCQPWVTISGNIRSRRRLEVRMERAMPYTTRHTSLARQGVTPPVWRGDSLGAASGRTT